MAQLAPLRPAPRPPHPRIRPPAAQPDARPEPARPLHPIVDDRAPRTRPAAAAALNVPGAARLPTGFLTREPRPGFADHIADLALRLTRDGTVPRVRPQEGDTPATYLLREYVHAHEAQLDLPGLRVEVTLDTTYRAFKTDATVDLHLFSTRGKIRDLRALRRTLHARDRGLFGRLIFELREALAPYAPIFTGLDAICGEETFLFGEDWMSNTAEALMEASHREDHDWDERTLTRWAERQGMLTPYALGRKYHRDRWTDTARVWQPVWPRLDAVQDVPGIPEVTALLRHVATLKAEWAVERRWWKDGQHPGHVDIVTCQAPGEQDPVLECYREMGSLLGDMNTQEPLIILEVMDAGDHAKAVQFLAACRDVRERVQAMWTALGT
jgi:hypothetical protein